MSLVPGTRLGPYEIVSPLGAGGMGEVFRARDTRLDRSVAIKVLPAEFAENVSLKARFEREAKTISQLEHPHICRLYDVGEEIPVGAHSSAPAAADQAAGVAGALLRAPTDSSSVSFLVMELLEGETLADRLTRGSLPIEQVLKLGIEIASALDRAHRAGVVHRDLKPGNIMLTKSGAKLLDFGLAKSSPYMSGASPPSATTLEGATQHKPLTEQGTILGTFQYMAPEQLEGEDADARTDIFAFGAVLYELLTGRRAFEAKTRTSLIAAIVDREPTPISQVQPLTPPSLEHLIKRCLEKDREDRWQSAHDIAEELKWIASVGSQAGVAAPLISKRKTRERLLLASTAVALIAAALAGWGWWRASHHRPDLVRLSIPLPPESTLSGIGLSNVAVSPDGRLIVYSAYRDGPLLYSRRVDSFESLPMSGTEGGEGPFFSPDGEWVGFFTPGAMKKVRISSGTPLVVVTTGGTPRGASWGTDGFIYYSPGPSSGLWRIPADGGRAEQLTTPAEAGGENSHRLPHLLPDGKHLLFTIRTDRIASFDEAKIAVLSLETKQWRVVLEGGFDAKYVATGDLLFGQRESLLTVPFDLDSLAVKGSPRVLVAGLMTSESSGAAQFAIADLAGTLVYVPSAGQTSGTTLLTVDRAGNVTKSVTVNRRFDAFRVSPDQRRLVTTVPAANDDVWTYDLERGTLTRVSFEPGDEWYPAWSADGSSVIFGSSRALYTQRVDGTSAARILVKGSIVRSPSCSPDGRYIAYAAISESTRADLWLFSLGDGKALPFVQTPSTEFDPLFSPDGRWVAYVSNASGRAEVYLRGREGGGQWQVSNDGGINPRWSLDGRELFYRRAGGFYAVPLGLGATPSIGKPQLLFTLEGISAYDVYGDGFLMVKIQQRVASATSLNVVLRWVDELRKAPRL